MIENKTRNKYEDWLIVIHHTTWWTLEQIQRMHYNNTLKPEYWYPNNMQPKWRKEDWSLFKYPDIQYHFLVDKDWTITQNRWLEQVSYHASNYPINMASIAVSFMGNYDNEMPTKEQRNAAIKIIKDIKNKINKNVVIKWHKDFHNTRCPWKNLYPLLNKMMQEVNETIKKWFYETQFEKEFWNSSIYSSLSWAITELVDTWKVDREYFYFNLIWLERIKKLIK